MPRLDRRHRAPGSARLILALCYDVRREKMLAGGGSPFFLVWPVVMGD